MTPDEPDDLDELRKHYPGAVVDEDQVAEIKARAEYAQLPWWQRLTTPTPKGWR